MKKAWIVFMLFGLTISAFGQKKVLLEKFTNIYCGSCPDKSILLTELEEQYPDLIWISHYSYSVFEYNPMVYPGGTEMWADLGVSGTPMAIVDRTPYNNSLGSSASAWETRIQQQQDAEDYVDIDFSNVDFDETTRELTFQVSCTFHTLPTNLENFRVLMYVTEDDVTWRQHSYYNNTPGHPLEGLGNVIQGYVHQNVLRNILSGGWGEENIIPNNPTIGQEYVKTFSYTVPDLYVPLNLELTAAVSQHDEANYLNRPVLNANRIQIKDFVITNTFEPIEASFNAFPNPTNGTINLQFQKIPTNLMLEDLNGRLIKQYTVDDLDMQIDLNDLSAGVYIFQVVDGKKRSSEKIVVW